MKLQEKMKKDKAFEYLIENLKKEFDEDIINIIMDNMLIVSNEEFEDIYNKADNTLFVDYIYARDVFSLSKEFVGANISKVKKNF